MPENNHYNEEQWLRTAFPVIIFSIFCSIALPNIILLFVKINNFKLTPFSRIVLGTVPVQICLLVPILFYLFIKCRGHFLRELQNKLKLNNWTYKYFFTAIKIEAIIFIPLCIITFCIHFILAYFGFSPSSPITILLTHADIKGILVVFLISVFVAPFGEEIVFRRIFYGFSSKLMSQTSAVIITSFIFATLHGGIVQLLPLTILGCILQKLYIKYKSLYPCIILHAVHNFIMMLLFFITWLNF